MKILVVDDHVMFAEAIRPLLQGLGAEVLPGARDGREGLALVRRERPDVVLVDLDLPDMSGVMLGRQILDELPGTKVVALAPSGRTDTSAEVLRAGFHGVVTKDTSTTRFVRSMKAVIEGSVVNVTPRIRRSHGGSNGSAALLASQLTQRELEVLGILVQGGSNAYIATRLALSPNTVRTHVQSILTKLQVRSRLEAAAFAVRHGIVGDGRRHA